MCHMIKGYTVGNTEEGVNSAEMSNYRTIRTVYIRHIQQYLNLTLPYHPVVKEASQLILAPL